MSLYDIFLTRAAMEHQNELNSDNAGIILGGLVQGVAKGIEEEQALMKQRKQQEETFKTLSKIGVDNKSKITTTIDGNGTSYKIERGDNADDLKVKHENRMASQYELNNATKLRQEFINRPEVKDYVTISTNVKAMEGLLAEAMRTEDKNNLVAVDQGLITMYNKLTDPASVVRESEYARTPGNLPLVNRIYGAIGKIQQGGAGLTNEDRQALVEGAKIIQKERGGQYNNTLGEYNDLSTQYGLDSSMVTRGMQPFREQIPEVTLDPIVVEYMKKYPGRTKEEIMRAMQKRKQ